MVGNIAVGNSDRLGTLLFQNSSKVDLVLLTLQNRDHFLSSIQFLVFASPYQFCAGILLVPICLCLLAERGSCTAQVVLEPTV